MAKPDSSTYWLVVPLLMALAPQVFFLPIWVSIATAIGLLWRLSPLWQKDSTGQKWLRIGLVAPALMAVFLEHHTVFGPRGGVSLLVLMSVLKLLESSGRRDHLVMTLAGYFLLMTVLIHDQRLPTAAWLVLAGIVLTASLVATQSCGSVSALKALRQGTALLLQGVPLALFLFVLFPRLHSPIGSLIHAGQAQTGLSDNMSPGSIAQLHKSDAVAFRADFGTRQVDGRQLYWRGPVLWYYDGRTWRRAESGQKQARADELGAPFDYTVTLEPHNMLWLPTTGLATTVSADGAHETAAFEWLAARPIDQRLRYTVHAWQEYRLEQALPPEMAALYLELPDGFNQETIALGQRWHAEYASPTKIIDAALAYFRNQPFYYTLSPPVLGSNAVDDFLFGTRRGFCEHYAGAFTVLMRAAGIPTRIVTGYLGGEYNPIGRYWIIRQRDAHAWAEVWLAGRGWTRVDPTAAVAPNRIEAGSNADVVDNQEVILNLPSTWLNPLIQSWDFINNRWNQWVIGYDAERQRHTLSAISPWLGDLRGMLWGLVSGAALLIGILALYLFRPSPHAHPDEASRLYNHFLRKLGHTGLVKGAAEGAENFARRAIASRPDLAGDIEEVSSLYTQIRYGDAPSEWLTRLRKRVQSFKPSARNH